MKLISGKHSGILMKRVAQLYRDGNSAYADVTVKVGDRLFKCHKLLLLLASKGFEQLFSSRVDGGSVQQDEGGDTVCFAVEGMDAIAFEHILEYIYTGEIEVDATDVERILDSSRKLFLTDLEECALEFIPRTLDGSNCVTYWRIAEKEKSREMIRACQAMYASTAKDLLGLDAILEFISVSTMVGLLADEYLPIHSEQEVCEMFVKWLRVHPLDKFEDMLPLIRWADVPLVYIQTKLITNDIFASNIACQSFLNKTVDFHLYGAQFKGLNHAIRSSVGERFLVVINRNLENVYSPVYDVYKVSFRPGNPVSKLVHQIPSGMNNFRITLASHEGVAYATSAGEDSKGIWKYDPRSGWNMCTSLPHVVEQSYPGFPVSTPLLVTPIFVDSTLYMFLGDATIYKYDIRENKAVRANAKLACPMSFFGIVAYKKLIYLFGGMTAEGLDHELYDTIQVYDAIKDTCTVLEQKLPSPLYNIRAVGWESCAILVLKETCVVFNFETGTCLERPRFKTDVDEFGLVLENEKLYLIGGRSRGQKFKIKSYKWNIWDPSCDTREIFGDNMGIGDDMGIGRPRHIRNKVCGCE